jgi:small subunit ribosomal protein S17e
MPYRSILDNTQDKMTTHTIKIPHDTHELLEERNIIIRSNRIYSIKLGGILMGIKPSYIKNLGTALLAKQQEYFSNSFEANKQQLGSSAVIESKRVRNRVAGYITRKMNAKKRT